MKGHDSQQDVKQQGAHHHHAKLLEETQQDVKLQNVRHHHAKLRGVEDNTGRGVHLQSSTTHHCLNVTHHNTSITNTQCYE